MGNFELWLKNRLKNGTISPPADIWEGINDRLDVNEVWDRVQTELDINEVWSGVSSRLGTAHLYPVYDRVGQAITVVSLILFMSLFFGPDIGVDDQVAVLNQTPGSVIDHEAITEKNDEIYEIAESSTSADIVLAPIANNQAIINSPRPPSRTVFSSLNEDASVLLSEEDPNLLKFDIVSKKSNLPGSHFYAFDQDSLAYINIVRKLEPVRNLYFGISATVKNNWLLNPKTFINLEPDELNATKLDLSTELGVVAGYDLNFKYGLQGEFYLISGEGQKYSEYIDGQYLPTSIDLTYSQLEVLIKKKDRNLFNSNSNISHNILAGVFISRLNKSTEQIGEGSKPSESYNSLNYGLSVGYEFSYRLSSRFSFAPSFRVRYGLKNIYRSQNSDPEILDETKTGSVGLNMSVLYHLTQKNK